jgi:acyl-CoA thioesterase FadM
MRDEYLATTRFADLDTQRHVTSRTYESFALEGRYRLLEKLGFAYEQVKNEHIYLTPLSGYVKFHRQQFPGAELRVETHAFPEAGGNIHWDQKIFEKGGELVCHLQQLTRPVRGAEPLALEVTADETREPVLYEPLKPWSGSGERIIAQYKLPYSDRDFAGKYNVASLWKIFEEGRWMFVEQVGLTFEKIVELDTTSFFMGSVANFFAEVPAGRTLQVMTWVERIDKIRYWFRQDVMHNGKLLISMRDEQLIVSLSRARPQRATPEFLKYIGKYLEFPS